MRRVHPDPTPEEAAAIAAVIATFEETGQPSPLAKLSGWTLAMRDPDLSLDEIRALMRTPR